MEAAEGAGFSVQRIDASSEGSNPKSALVIFQHGRYTIVAKAVFLLVGVLETGKTIEPRVIAVQPIDGTHPKLPLAVLINTRNVAVAEAIRIFWRVFVHGHLVSVVTVQAVTSAQPHEAPMVLMDGFDGAVGKAVFVLDVFEVEFGLLSLGIAPRQKA